MSCRFRPHVGCVMAVLLIGIALRPATASAEPQLLGAGAPAPRWSTSRWPDPTPSSPARAVSTSTSTRSSSDATTAWVGCCGRARGGLAPARPKRNRGCRTGHPIGPDRVLYVGGSAAHGCAADEGSWFLRAYGPGGSLLWHRQARHAPTCDWRAASAIDDVAVRSGVLTAARNVCGGDFCDGFVDVFSTGGRALRAIP